MRAAAGAEEFERAARLRDDIKALQRALEKQAVVLGDGTDCDVIALAEDQLEAAVQVFYVRGGRVRGQRGWVLDKVEDVTTAGWSSISSARFTATTPSRPASPARAQAGRRPAGRAGQVLAASRARCSCPCCRRIPAAMRSG
jgi:hypothetical protein